MAFELLACAPADVVSTLAAAIATAKGGDRLAPVTVVVPTNVSGVMARRALGRTTGILGVDMVTLNRLAELLAGPALARARRQPVSTPLLELTVRRVLDETPGSYAAVAHHPATVVALRTLHQELRLTGEYGAEQLALSRRGRDAARVSRAVERILRRAWYDEADLLAGATERLRTEHVAGLERIVLHLPAPFDALSQAFVEQLAATGHVTVVMAFTGNDAADHEQHRFLRQFGLARPDTIDRGPEGPTQRPLRVVSTTDADDEVRIAVRTIVDAARGELTGEPVAFDRIAVLWPNQRPYARLVEHHLAADGVPWNGRGGTELSERIAPRLLLDLLDVDRRGLQRRALFELLADLPLKDAAGRPLRTAEWQRVSRRAGVSRDEDWIPRLSALVEHDRWGFAARTLRDFVVELRETLGDPRSTRRWSEWVEWCNEQIVRWLGQRAIMRLSDTEYRAWEALMSALERLKSLDSVAEPVTRSEFRTVLDNELAELGVREGRIGTGVTIGSLASAAGLVVDVAIIVGAAEGHLPPAPRPDPLVSAADRERAGLVSADERVRRLHHQFLATIQSARTVITMPRGDLRSTTANQPTRWLDPDTLGQVEVVDSATSGLERLGFAPGERERRLRDRLRHTASAPLARTDPVVVDDPITQRGLALTSARQSSHLSEYDGDLSSVGVPALAYTTGGSVAEVRPVSPTQIQFWASCPHAYFVRYHLGVVPIEEPDSQISINALDRGLVHHDVLDALHRDVLSGALPQPTHTGWTDEHRTALLDHFDRACDRAERSGRTGRPATWASENERMRRDLLGWLERDSAIVRDNGATIVASEYRFPSDQDSTARPIVLPLTDDRAVLVHGTIDRLDRWNDGRIVVTDHKTGKADAYRRLTEADPTLGGSVFQLPTYAAAARALAGGVDLNDDVRVRAEYSMFERGGYQRIGIDFDDEVWANVRSDLGDIVDGIESGWFPQVPPTPGFHFYTECLYCDPDELGTTDAFERWDSKRHDDRIAAWFADADADDDGTPGA